MNSLLKAIGIDYAGIAVAAASSTDSNSSRFDLQNYDGVIFFTTITDSVATGVATLTIQTNSIDSDTGMTASAAVDTATCAVNDDINGDLLMVELVKPLERYVQGVRVSATANIAFGEIHCLRYKGKKKLPITQTDGGISAVDS